MINQLVACECESILWHFPVWTLRVDRRMLDQYDLGTTQIEIYILDPMAFSCVDVASRQENADPFMRCQRNVIWMPVIDNRNKHTQSLF